jgi:hypothetical protein
VKRNATGGRPPMARRGLGPGARIGRAPAPGGAGGARVRGTGAERRAPTCGLPEPRLQGLDDSDARALLESVIPGPIDERVRDRIVAETRGNPLALLELPRGRSVAERAGGLVVPAPLGLSGSIDDGFQRRLDALPANTRRLLQLAAADQLGIQPEVVTPAVEADLPEIRTQVRFRHPLVRTAASRSASPGRDPADRPRPGGPRPVGLDRSPSGTLFLVGGVLTGIGASAIFRGSLGVALATSRADERAGTLATFFKPAMRPSRCRCSASASRFST